MVQDFKYFKTLSLYVYNACGINVLNFNLDVTQRLKWSAWSAWLCHQFWVNRKDEYFCQFLSLSFCKCPWHLIKDEAGMPEIKQVNTGFKCVHTQLSASVNVQIWCLLFRNDYGLLWVWFVVAAL